MIEEYAEEGKSIDALIDYLKELGLIDENGLSDALDDSTTGMIIQEIIDYKDDGKTMDELDDNYGGTGNLSVGSSFWIADISDVIASIPDFNQKAYEWLQDFDGYVTGAWNTYRFGDNYAYVDINQNLVSTPDYISFEVDDIVMFVYGGSDGSVMIYNKESLPSLWIELNEGVIESVRFKEESLKGFYPVYLKAVAEWNTLLGTSGFSVSSFFDTRAVNLFLLSKN